MNKYYKILGVTENSTKEEIKSAHRSLLKKYHPDTYKGDKNFAVKKSAEINEAYAQVLADREVKGYAKPKKAEDKEDFKQEKEVYKSNLKNKKSGANKKTIKQEVKDDIKVKNNKKTEEKINFEEYAKKSVENSSSKISNLYLSQEDINNEKKSKRFLDALIISLSIITILMILLIIFL